jgi:hypothetical protein
MNNRIETSPSLPVANYSPAVARAVAWLGDRYLLAQPINAARRSQSTAAKPRTGTRDPSQLRGDGATAR